MKIENYAFPNLRGSEIGWRMCFENNIATYCNYYDINYELMFINALRINYDINNKSEIFWKRVVFKTLKVENLLKYCSIKLDFFNNVERIKTACEEKKMCMTIMDSYFCPWDKFYKKEHRNEHYFLIYEYRDNKYICNDPVYKCTGVELDMELLNNKYDSHVEISHKKLDKKIDYIVLLRKELAAVIESKKYDNFGYFITDLKHDFEEINQEGIQILHDIFEAIEKNLVQFCALLKLFEKSNPQVNLEKFIARLLKASGYWRIMQQELRNCKVSDISSNMKTEYLRYIDKAINLEKQVVLDMAKYIE